MPPKKKQQQKANAKSKPPASGSKPAPKLQISSENERRLRRLLLNNERNPPAPAPAQAPLAAALPPDLSIPSAASDGGGPSRAQKAKRLRAVYDKLSLEGFSSDQIERALTALKEIATFESALDWLCFNVPGNELPIKFSSTGASTSIQEGTVTIVSAARQDHISQQQRQDALREKESIPGVPLKIKVQRDELSIDFGNSSDKEWIQRYLEQEEDEDEQEDNPEPLKNNPEYRAASIIEEYHRARAGALEAKKKGDKKSQENFSDIISKLRKELSLLGISNEIPIPNFENDLTIDYCDDISSNSSYYGNLESKEPDANSSKTTAFENKALVDVNTDEGFYQKENDPTVALPATDADGNTNELAELELDNLFSEDPADVVPAERLMQQPKNRVLQAAHGYNLGNIDEIWKKGDLGKFPKAVLQKICQRLGWDPPKYSKQSGKEDKFQYSVGILRTASGRGKSRKAGGFITIHLPKNEEAFKSVEEAQNKVACFALYQLFPELPLNQMLLEPYPSFISMWQKDDFSIKLEDIEDARRSEFINSLLDPERPSSIHPLDAQNVSLHQDVEPQCVEEAYDDSLEKIRVLGSDNTGGAYSEQTENILLIKEQQDKMKLPNYMKMLEARAALPISRLKSDILQLLAENNVIVVHGETGCGKTTQVPQFILDDMIQSGHGAYCNIVCTQPRRLAAISVAERVSDERCESSPGSDGSLVGYQVRLDSARNERTKLLFCTTGVLLRKLTGNKELAGFTHVIVDEVHERSILGDFLLIVLKNILEKQSDNQGKKLKVVLMSATVDSSLFSRYFGNCPVISAEGRTHPVSTCFLEDVYQKLGYILPSDSPAYGALVTSSKQKLRSSSVDHHRGKKNLVLSSWGDDSLLFEDYVNPCYIPYHYISYSERTRQNLKHLNEDVIDFDLLEDLIRFIDQNYPSGAILVFLPGVAEIDMLVDKLTSSVQFGGVSSEWILPLHSSLAATEQRKVFLTPPRNMRKVIIATDIAETSITIDDVTYVVDTGKHKENRYNAQKKMSSMVEDWISQANAKQRRGRAGRVKPGICFCMYTSYRFEKLMRSFQIPEMLRMQLTELCLQIKSLSLGDVKSFLMKAIEPPREDAITSAINILYEVGAFEGNEELSPLGYHLAKLPVDVLIGKMMLYGAIFGCLSPILSVAAFLSYKTPFVYPRDEKQNVERAKSALLNGSSGGGTTSDDGIKQSDHLLMVVAYDKWARILHENGSKAAQQFCRSFFLNGSVMYMIRDMRVQFGSLLADIGLLKFPDRFQLRDKRRDKLESWLADVSQPFNLYSNHSSIIQSIICAGLYPNVAATIEGIVGQGSLASRALCNSTSLNDQRTWFDGRREVHIHPSSINHNVKNFQYPFLVFLEKVETSKVYIRDCSIISPYSILLFGGSMVIQHQEGLVFIDGWLKLNAPAQTAVLFKELRATLHAVLKELISKPEMATSVNNEVVKYIVQLLLEEHKVQVSKQ